MKSRGLSIYTLFIVGTSLILLAYFSCTQDNAWILFFYIVIFCMNILNIYLFKRNKRYFDFPTKMAIDIFCYNTIVVILIFWALQSTYGSPYLGGGSDDLRYEMRAYDAMINGRLANYKTFSDTLGAEYAGYYYFVALIQYVAKSNYHTVMPRLFNSLFLSIISILTYKIGIESDLSEKAAHSGAYLIGMFPLMCYFSATVVRDTIIVLLILIFADILIRFRLGSNDIFERIKLLLSACAINILLWQFRRQTVVAIIFVTIIVLLLDLMSRKLNARTFFLGFIFSLLIFGVTYLTFEAWSPYLTREFGKSLTYTERFYEGGEIGLSRYVWSAQPPISYIVRAAYGLIAPLPIPSTNPLDAYQSFGSFLGLLLLPFFFLQMPNVLFNPKQRVLFIFWFVLFMGSTQTVFAYRHFLQFYPFMFLLAWEGMCRYKSRSILVLGADLLFLGLMGILYLVLKL